MNYDLRFMTSNNVLIDTTIRKVICIAVTDTGVSLESSKDGWFLFHLDGKYKKFADIDNATLRRVFVVTDEELHKIKLQLGLDELK